MNCILFAAVAFAFVLACYAENNVPSEVISIAASSTANQYATSWSYTFSAGSKGRIPTFVCIELCEEFVSNERAVGNRNATFHQVIGWYGFNSWCARWSVKDYVDEDGKWLLSILDAKNAGGCQSGYIAKAGPYYTEQDPSQGGDSTQGPAGTCCH